MSNQPYIRIYDLKKKKKKKNIFVNQIMVLN
jgi:hypothetical protein